MPVDIVPGLRLFKQGPTVAPPSLTSQTDVHLSPIVGGLKHLATCTLGFLEYPSPQQPSRNKAGKAPSVQVSYPSRGQSKVAHNGPI